MIDAYHFVGATLRDGAPVPADGVWLEHAGPLVMCASGLHAARHSFDALAYAPSPLLCRVQMDGETVEQDDKLVSRRRRILARIDVTDLLWAFARQCASDVLPLWDAPDVVRRYLTTGDETLRDAARAAAGTAAWDAAAAARDAARAAAWDAARAARAAAWDGAAAARYAAGAAARAAAWDAAGDAAGAAARDAARAAAWDAAAAARAAAGAAAWDATWAAARAAQRASFSTLVTAAFEAQDRT